MATAALFCIAISESTPDNASPDTIEVDVVMEVLPITRD
jgi:hypothetical protein